MWACGNHYYQNNGNIHSYPPYESSSHFITIFPFQKCPLQFLARQLCPLSFSCSTTLPPLPLCHLCHYYLPVPSSLPSASLILPAAAFFFFKLTSGSLLWTHQWWPSSLNSLVAASLSFQTQDLNLPFLLFPISRSVFHLFIARFPDLIMLLCEFFSWCCYLNTRC